jgi:hypothetical protein
MAAPKIIKCHHCTKIFFDAGTEFCPFCKKSLKEDLGIFNSIFGDSGPFKDFFTGGK